ncbi:mCG147137 [Mus musculus]|jgi:hypothetical protein|nr:mCG147137 [Mus musculus]
MLLKRMSTRPHAALISSEVGTLRESFFGIILIYSNVKGCSGLLSVTVIRHLPKPTWEERVYFIIQFPGHNPSLGEVRAATPWKNPEAELKQRP